MVTQSKILKKYARLKHILSGRPLAKISKEIENKNITTLEGVDKFVKENFNYKIISKEKIHNERRGQGVVK